MTKDITEMQPEELLKHIEDAQKLLQKKKDDELENLAKDIAAIVGKSSFSLLDVAKKLGLKLADETAEQKDKPRAKSDNKYVNPNNPKEGWPGIGAPPKWIKEYVAHLNIEKFSKNDPAIAAELEKILKK